MPSRSLTVLFPLSRSPSLSVYPSLLRSPPPRRNPLPPSLSRSYPRSLAYDTTRFSRGLFSLGSLARSSRLVWSRLTS